MSVNMIERLPSVPSHVPPQLVVDFDVYKPCAAEEDFYLAWRSFQDRHASPLVWSTQQGGHWIPTRGADVFALYRDHERLSSDSNVVPALPGGQAPLGAIGLDPPEHTHYRKFLTLGLSPRAVQAREPRIRAMAVSLIEQLASRDRCEFVGAYADVLPFAVLLDLLELQVEDRPMLQGWAADVVRGDLEARAKGFQCIGHYLEPLILARRGGEGEDLLTRIANARIEGELLPLKSLLRNPAKHLRSERHWGDGD